MAQFTKLEISKEVLEKMITLYNSGKSSPFIAKEVGISAFSVMKILKENGIQARVNKNAKKDRP